MIIFVALLAVYAIDAFGGGANNTTDSTLTPQSSTIGTVTALPTVSTVFVDGENVSFDAFNINGFNYFKLRDVAYILSGTTRQFDVGWDNENNAILLISDSPYSIVGGGMASAAEGNKQATPSTSRIYLDSNEVQLTAYNIEGSNYFMLRDIGQVIDFYVNWDEENERIIIDTSEPIGDSTIVGPAHDLISELTSTNIEYQRITAQEAKEMMDSGEPFILLDVRTDAEFRDRRIEGAILIPDFEIASRATAELPDKSKLILIYCRTGRRSHDAAWELINMGYTNVYDFGGIVVWPFGTISG